MRTLPAALLTIFLGGCVSGPPELTVEQLRKIGDLEIFRTGTAPKKEFKIIADIEAADCSGPVTRLYGDEGKAIDTLKMKAIEIGGDAIVDVSCKSVPFVNNCWAAKKCNGKAVGWK